MLLLSQNSYQKLNDHIENIPFNYLFAKAVVDKTVSGRIFVDNLEHPKTFYIAHRYGMSLLGGDSTNFQFNLAFKDYALNLRQAKRDIEWMQIFPNEWFSVLEKLFSNTLIKAEDNKEKSNDKLIELNTRVNFKFNRQKFLSSREIFNSDSRLRIVENTSSAYDEMTGSVVPSAFWNSQVEFKSKGVSFGLYYDEKLASVSFASFVAPGKLELGIETRHEFRGHGFAEKVCTAMIDYCLQKDLEPIWACRLENTGSFKLAQKLGFEPCMFLPYYRLCP